jgi:hypothetical protein
MDTTWILAYLCIDAMLRISLYSYPYLNSQNGFVFLIIAYVFSSIKLGKRAEQLLPGSQGVWGRRGRGFRAAGRNVPMYAHVNKCIKHF